MKILYVTTLSGTINAFLIPHIRMLVELGHSVDIACKITKSLKQELYDMGCNIYDVSFDRSPLKSDNYNAYKELKEIIKKEKYDIIHTHTPIASAITRLACKNTKETKVFYTAHGFHFHKGAPLKNWLIFYPLEKWLSEYTDTLITINQEDYRRVKNKFNAKRIEHIPGVGLDIDKFKNVVVDIKTKREEIGVPQDSFVVLSVGELNKNKNHEVVIRAIAKLNNSNIHYVICGKGPLESYLKDLAIELGIGENIHLLGFRKDIPEVCKISDVFIFPSLREGLPVSVMEAMAVGMPILGSGIRGNTDLIINDKGGYIFNPTDVEELEKSLAYIFEKYIDVAPQFGKFNQERILNYAENAILDNLKAIYDL